MRIFDINNPVIAAIMKIADCILISFLWLVFSLPIITIGASSAAMYSTVYHYLRKEEGYLFRMFLAAFRENLRRSTILWFIALAIQAFLWLDALVFRSMKLKGEWMGNFYWLLLMLCCVALVWAVYLTAYAARFTGTVREVVKFSLFLILLHPLRAILVLLVVLAGLALVIVGPGLVLIVPAAVCLICSFITEKVFLIHMREEDVKKTIKENERL